MTVKRLLIVGGTGFLGTTFLEHYAEQYDVYSISRAKAKSIIPGVTYIYGDWKNRSFIDSVVSRNTFDCVLLLACSSHPRSSNEDPLQDFEENVTPAIYLVNRLVRAGIPRIIYASSAGALYSPADHEVTEENTASIPMSAYASAKLSIEQYLGVYGMLSKSAFISLRISNPYGENQNPKGNQGIVAIFSDRALRGESIKIFPDGLVKKDYIYAHDVASAFASAIECDKQLLTIGNNIFNIGSGHSYSALDIAMEIVDIVGRSTIISTPASTKNEKVPSIALNIDKAKSMLGWEPLVSFNEGLQCTIDHFRRSDQYVEKKNSEDVWDTIPKEA